MNDGSDGRGGVVFADGYVVPITGLLSLLFALLAGMTALPALSGSAGDLALPVVFGISSLACFRIRQRYVAALDGEGR
ncbi:hypothetical protein GRS48_13385 [Halorubrum sp. JWXQ-INN 858]|uniref:hypothetical protein n=1 Tax=Halorubrum sp. JWXQ-INN 858 TaxID=2690782 RepID=UPI001358E00B|nr:hypothetical protein [Halorubrum sp. JWXQ-INN 858]MWV65805.1 hypothetical protein [Halorubrum sp. JWXQ-INN 858]